MLKLFTFTTILAYAQAIRCPRIVCLIVTCPDVSACNGVIKKGLCGCCDVCQVLKGPCAKETDDLKARFQHHADNGMAPLGPSLPVCTTDGYYAPKQCRGSRCLCVTRNGASIGSYIVNRSEGDNVNCQCARDEYEYKKTGLLGKSFRCAPNGNYAPVQCTGSMCYCVDQKGSQIGTNTVNIGSIDRLIC